jgi:hypothetical protein
MPLHKVEMIGIEAEFLPLRQSEPVDCAELKIPCDKFRALAEVRALPGAALPVVLGNFDVEFHRVKQLCRQHALTPFFGEYEWSPELYARFTALMEKDKGIPKWINIYGKQLGGDKGKRGGGLHIHFSSTVKQRKGQGFTYLTEPVVQHIVRKLDEHFDEAIKRCSGEYRVPGMYELKPWGFEYRSLPFNSWAIENMVEIADFALNTLREATAARIVIESAAVQPCVKPEGSVVDDSDDESRVVLI